MSADPDLVWNIHELKEHVGRRHGEGHGEKVWEPLQSVLFRIRAMDYHAKECHRLTHNSDALAHEDTGPLAFLKDMLGCTGKGDEAVKRSYDQFSAEAHAIASAQAAHACLDIFAHAVYWALAMDRKKPLKDRDICFGKILHQLADEPRAAAVHALADEVYKAPQTAYLIAYVSTVKHRRLIRARPSVRFDEAAGYGLRIKAFRHDSKTHGGDFEEKWVQDFLNCDNVFVVQSLVRTGSALNRFVG